MIDILIQDGIIITMDPERRLIERGSIAVHDSRIVDIGPSDEMEGKYTARKVINAKRMVVMPGLIDGHAHAGHGLVKTLGGDNSQLWSEACEKIYAEDTDEMFWFAEAQLSALERLKSGTTCGVSLLGGGPDLMRVDDPVYAEEHCRAVGKIGIRSFLAVGPTRPPYPRRFIRYNNGEAEEQMISFEKQMETCETVIQDRHNSENGKIKICLNFPVYTKEDADKTESWDEIKKQARTVRDLSKKHGLLFSQDGHRGGTVKIAHEEMNLLGSDALFSHSIDLDEEEIELCRRTNTRIAHNPSAKMSILGRCPVPELLDAGVVVMLGSDGTAPDRSCDMFRHMNRCMHYHRTYFHDFNILPAGKVLEMTTIDAAKALGVEKELGSLEKGKKADIILIDMYKPHLYPLQMPLYRTLYYATGADVDTVIVDGRLLMEHREVKTAVESEVLDFAEEQTQVMLDRAQVRHLLDTPESFWGKSRYSFKKP